MQELLLDEVKDLYDAEKQLVRALPKFAKAASDPELGEAFQNHLEQTREHVERLDRVFEMLGQKAKGKPCKGMKGLVEEGSEVIGEDREDVAADAAIIGAAQRVEHYEMAAYGTARSLAQSIGMKDAAELLQQTLTEEGETDKKLTQIAKRLLQASKQRGASGSEEKQRGASQGQQNGKKGAPGAKRKEAGKSNRSSGSGRNVTTDHDEIRRWAEDRGAQPACVKGTGRKGDIGMLRLDFPGYSGEDSLQPISWDDFFEKFDENGLALLYQEKTSGGQKSNFNKLVDRGRAA